MRGTVSWWAMGARPSAAVRSLGALHGTGARALVTAGAGGLLVLYPAPQGAWPLAAVAPPAAAVQGWSVGVSGVWYKEELDLTLDWGRFWSGVGADTAEGVGQGDGEDQVFGLMVARLSPELVRLNQGLDSWLMQAYVARFGQWPPVCVLRASDPAVSLHLLRARDLGALVEAARWLRHAVVRKRGEHQGEALWSWSELIVGAPVNLAPFGAMGGDQEPACPEPFPWMVSAPAPRGPALPGQLTLRLRVGPGGAALGLAAFNELRARVDTADATGGYPYVPGPDALTFAVNIPDLRAEGGWARVRTALAARLAPPTGGFRGELFVDVGLPGLIPAGFAAESGVADSFAIEARRAARDLRTQRLRDALLSPVSGLRVRLDALVDALRVSRVARDELASAAECFASFLSDAPDLAGLIGAPLLALLRWPRPAPGVGAARSAIAVQRVDQREAARFEALRSALLHIRNERPHPDAAPSLAMRHAGGGEPPEVRDVVATYGAAVRALSRGFPLGAGGPAAGGIADAAGGPLALIVRGVEPWPRGRGLAPGLVQLLVPVGVSCPQDLVIGPALAEATLDAAEGRERADVHVPAERAVYDQMDRLAALTSVPLDEGDSVNELLERVAEGLRRFPMGPTPELRVGRDRTGLWAAFGKIVRTFPSLQIGVVMTELLSRDRDGGPLSPPGVVGPLTWALVGPLIVRGSVGHGAAHEVTPLGCDVAVLSALLVLGWETGTTRGAEDRGRAPTWVEQGKLLLDRALEHGALLFDDETRGSGLSDAQDPTRALGVLRALREDLGADTGRWLASVGRIRVGLDELCEGDSRHRDPRGVDHLEVIETWRALTHAALQRQWSRANARPYIDAAGEVGAKARRDVLNAIASGVTPRGRAGLQSVTPWIPFVGLPEDAAGEGSLAVSAWRWSGDAAPAALVLERRLCDLPRPRRWLGMVELCATIASLGWEDGVGVAEEMVRWLESDAPVR